MRKADDFVAIGALRVKYIFSTSTDQSVPVDKQAVSGLDYITTQGMAIIQENVTRVPIEVVIKQVLNILIIMLYLSM